MSDIAKQVVCLALGLVGGLALASALSPASPERDRTCQPLTGPTAENDRKAGDGFRQKETCKGRVTFAAVPTRGIVHDTSQDKSGVSAANDGLAISDPPLLRLERFGKNELLLGREHTRRIARSRILIMGTGGVGSWVVETLARAGVGTLVLVDPGLVKISNCSQQIPALSSTVGQLKVDVLARRLRDINPDINVITYPHPAGPLNARDILLRFGRATDILAAGDSATGGGPPLFDAVVDCADKITDKVAMHAAALELQIPCVVTTFGAATRLIPSLLRVADVSKTTHCPMGKQVRKRLAAMGIRRGVTCVYSLEKPRNRYMTSSDRMVDLAIDTNNARTKNHAQNNEARDNREDDNENHNDKKNNKNNKSNKNNSNHDNNNSNNNNNKNNNKYSGGGKDTRWTPSPMGSWVVLPAMFALHAAHHVLMSLASSPSASASASPSPAPLSKTHKQKKKEGSKSARRRDRWSADRNSTATIVTTTTTTTTNSSTMSEATMTVKTTSNATTSADVDTVSTLGADEKEEKPHEQARVDVDDQEQDDEDEDEEDRDRQFPYEGLDIPEHGFAARRARQLKKQTQSTTPSR